MQLVEKTKLYVHRQKTAVVAFNSHLSADIVLDLNMTWDVALSSPQIQYAKPPLIGFHASGWRG
ncbi:hypothetical protein ACO0LC_20145 [Undibacterium sp. JH2W]